MSGVIVCFDLAFAGRRWTITRIAAGNRQVSIRGGSLKCSIWIGYRLIRHASTFACDLTKPQYFIATYLCKVSKLTNFIMSFDLHDDHSVIPDPPESADIDARWATRPESRERGVVLESQDNLRVLADLVRGMRKETITDADGKLWEVLARRAGTDEVVSNDPWTPYQVSDSRIGIRTGLINGTVIPINANTEVIVPSALTQFWLELSFVGHNLTSAKYGAGASVPTNPIPGATFPTKVYYRLFALKRKAAGGIDWESLVQYARRNFSVISYVANITGEAPEYSVEYGIAFVE